MSKLDLKYRPQTFSQVIGNSGIKNLLLTRSRNGSLADQSMMLSGPKGCGKTSLARIIAKAISCTNLQDGEPCNECINCISIINESDQNFQEMDAASQGTVDNIREMVREADYQSLNGMKQVYIVDEAQRLSHSAQEAFLKAIESRLFIVILCTTDPEKVKVPIRSRLEEYPVHPPSQLELSTWMNGICKAESIDFNDDGLELIIKIKENCPRACVLALSTISQLGTISSDNVKKYYRFDSYVKIVEILSVLDISPDVAFNMLDSLASEESPTWIRDNIVKAIASSLRVGVGAKSMYPVDIGNFFAKRGRNWANAATSLSALDRPSMSDIEAILLRDSQVVMNVPVIQDQIIVQKDKVIIQSSSLQPNPEVVVPSAKPTETISHNSPSSPSSPSLQMVPEPAQKVEAPSKIVKQVTVDGINFSSNETLTSLDKKLIPASHDTTGHDNTIEKVQLNADHVPITEKEYTSSLLSRLRR